MFILDATISTCTSTPVFLFASSPDPQLSVDVLQVGFIVFVLSAVIVLEPQD